jgi:leucyl aminopeptidase (aminopeptidase T)
MSSNLLLMVEQYHMISRQNHCDDELDMENSMMETANVIVTSVACSRKKSNMLIVCGLHNKVFAEHIMLESYRVGAHPYLWVFDENFFLKHSNMISEDVIVVLPEHTRSLLEKSDVVIWLSQFEDFEKFPANIRRAVSSFWDAVYEVAKSKPLLLVNLPSAKYIEAMGVDYEDFLRAFMNAVKVDYRKLRKTGLNIASELDGKDRIHVYDPNGTDLVFSIKGRHVGVESGTLEDCFSTGRECEVEVPAGEVYVAPVESSANGMLVVDQVRDYGIKELRLSFENGKIIDFKAEKGSDTFKKILEKAKGDKDRIAELGIGINYGMKPMGRSVYDEKALGTAHIAIGNNIHLGGVNKASIHIDFILHNPTIKADGELIMDTGKLS